MEITITTLNLSNYVCKVFSSDFMKNQIKAPSRDGPIIAFALVASIGKAHNFKNGRQLAAWLGLTPLQYNCGGKLKLGRITKAGDLYLRTFLIQGARSIRIGAEKITDSFNRWVCPMVERRGYLRAVVALPSPPKMPYCAENHCITMMISGCTQPVNA